jgi:hypothetical protein
LHRDEPRAIEPATQNPSDPGEEEPMKILDVRIAMQFPLRLNKLPFKVMACALLPETFPSGHRGGVMFKLWWHPTSWNSSKYSINAPSLDHTRR